jgi:hypothetical protein
MQTKKQLNVRVPPEALDRLRYLHARLGKLRSHPHSQAGAVRYAWRVAEAVAEHEPAPTRGMGILPF